MQAVTPPTPIPVGDLVFVGSGLVRPECVLEDTNPARVQWSEDAYRGCLLGDSIACFRTSVAGQAPSHWDF